MPNGRGTTTRKQKRSPVTKTGDTGETGLLYGGRVPKSDPRVEAYGTVDEAVSAIGLARAMAVKPLSREISLATQKELFTISAELATDPKRYDKFKQHFKTVSAAMVIGLEKSIARLERALNIPPSFVVPGATPSSGAFDLARTIVRRAERRVVGLKLEGLMTNPEIVRYLNRLSDLLYELARYEAKGLGREIPVSGKK